MYLLIIFLCGVGSGNGCSVTTVTLPTREVCFNAVLEVETQNGVYSPFRAKGICIKQVG